MPPLPKKAMTRSPSETQVAVAQPFILWLGSGTPVQAVSCHTIFPLSRSTHKTTRFFPFSSAAVRKMRLPTTHGDDCPTPGNAVFQTTDLASHLVGRLLSFEWPLPCGPRQLGQS